jgi:excinuclease ABC subunit C
MNEVVGRRFRHGLEESKEREEAGQSMEGGKFSDMPDLVLIDGGPEQLAFALRAMREAGADVPMFGLAKRLEEIYLPDRELPILLDRRSPALHLIQRIRDEAHRFAITHHRNLRGKENIHSQIEDIPGIGPLRRKALLKQFHSLQAVRNASLEELLSTPGMNRPAAEAVIKWAEEKKA